MMYAISQGREDEYHVWYGTDMVCSSPNWRDIINFLKAMYKQNGYNELRNLFNFNILCRTNGWLNIYCLSKDRSSK